MRLSLDREKGGEGQFGLGKNEVYAVRCFWALHVFEDVFGGTGIFEYAFHKNTFLLLIVETSCFHKF